MPGPVRVAYKGRTPDDKSLKAMSWVLTNPGTTFKMSMPHSFVRIKLDKMETNWYFFPLMPPIPPKRVKYGDPQEYKIKDAPEFSSRSRACLWVEWAASGVKAAKMCR